MLAASLTLAACGSSGTHAQSQRHTTKVSTSPVAVYTLFEHAAQQDNFAANSELAQATVAAIGACMRSKGFVFYDYSVPMGTPFISAYQHPYASLAKRELYGYGLYQAFLAGSHQAQPGGRNHRYVMSLSPSQRRRYDDALFGPPGHQARTFNLVGFGKQLIATGGCQGDQAVRAVYGSTVAGWYAASLTEFPERELASLEQAPSFQASEAKWSACMRKAGYAFSSPADAISELEDRYEQDGPTLALKQEEIDIAVTDYHCAVSTGFRSVYDQALRASVTDLSAQYRLLVAESARDFDAALRRAQRILG